MDVKWPEKPKIRQHDDDFDNGYESGQRIMHDKFMEVINESTAVPVPSVEDILNILDKMIFGYSLTYKKEVSQAIRDMMMGKTK